MRCYATRDQLLSAFASLTNSDLLALRKAATRMLHGTQFSEPADLMHEGLTRCLDGRRQWPTEVSFPLFLSNAMRSIASADRAHRRPWVAVPDQEDLGELSRQEVGEAKGLSAEDERVEMERIAALLAGAEAIRQAFGDDPHATSVIGGWMSEQSASEVMAAEGMTHRDYDSARKRVQRWAKLNGARDTRRTL